MSHDTLVYHGRSVWYCPDHMIGTVDSSHKYIAINGHAYVLMVLAPANNGAFKPIGFIDVQLLGYSSVKHWLSGTQLGY